MEAPPPVIAIARRRSFMGWQAVPTIAGRIIHIPANIPHRYQLVINYP